MLIGIRGTESLIIAYLHSLLHEELVVQATGTEGEDAAMCMYEGKSKTIRTFAITHI
jgi:hypothetical protein